MDLETFKKKWIGRSVIVVDKVHPHYKETGIVSGVDRTAAGLAMSIKNDDYTSIMYGEEFYIFNGSQIKVI